MPQSHQPHQPRLKLCLRRVSHCVQNVYYHVNTRIIQKDHVPTTVHERLHAHFDLLFRYAILSAVGIGIVLTIKDVVDSRGYSLIKMKPKRRLASS